MFDLHSANYWPTSLLYVGNVSEWAEAADANTESNSWNSKFFVSRCKNKKKRCKSSHSTNANEPRRTHSQRRVASHSRLPSFTPHPSPARRPMSDNAVENWITWKRCNLSRKYGLKLVLPRFRLQFASLPVEETNADKQREKRPKKYEKATIKTTAKAAYAIKKNTHNTFKCCYKPTL